jgi:hypothetical protein
MGTMAKEGSGVRPVAMNAYRGMWLGLALAAAEAAGEAARDGGYKLTVEQLDRVNRAIREATFWLVVQVADWSETTDEALEGAARDLGELVLHAVLGPPAASALN